MSNHHAIAAVTATISQLLKDINKSVPGATVTLGPPDLAIKASTDSLNVFLYQVKLNSAYRNLELPTCNPSGEQANRPLALNLCYLLTALTADNDELKAQQILASALGILYGNPVLTKQQISEAIKNNPKIAGSDLANQVELIRLSFQDLSIEEIAKLWVSFFKTNYRISMAYQADVVLLEGKQEPERIFPISLHTGKTDKLR